MAESKRVTDIRESDTAAAYLAEAEEYSRHEDTARMSEALERLSASPDCSATHRYKGAKLLAAAGATADAIRFYREAGAAFIDPEADTGRAREAYSEAHALDLQDLDIIFDRIDRELRTQYRLGYYPNPRGPANTYRSIEVKVLDNYKVRHRKTYLTGPQ